MSTSEVSSQARVDYIDATNKFIKALTHSLDSAQEGLPLTNEVRVLRIEQRAAHWEYNEAVAAARG